MNIFDILIGFVGGGAIGGGALYALQEGKIREARQKYAKIRTDLGETEAELKDSKEQLKLLALSEERIRNIEATYREEVAKLQEELEDSQGRLQEIASATPAQAVEVADKTQIQPLQPEYEAKIEELRQSYQSQIQEIIDGKQGEMEALRQSQQEQILELEKGYQSQIQQLEQGYQSQLLELQNARQAVVDDRTTEIVEPWDDFPDSPSAEEINPFDDFITEETLVLPPEFAPETPLETPVSESEFSSEMNPFDGFITEETLVLEPEFAPEMPLETPVSEETFDGLNSIEETLVSSEMTESEDFPVMEEQAISDWEMSAAEIEFLNSLTLEEETRTIGSLEELSGNYGQIQETVSSDTIFSDLLAPDTEKFADNQNFLDDLFADTDDSNNPELFDYFAEETPTVASNRQNVASVASDQEELDFFSMLDNEEMANLESLPSDEELPLDDLFSDDLFSDGDNSKTTRLESHQ
jgi:gas vesicle protein